MKPVDRQKICPNCDGRIPFDATQCHYCFSSVPAESSSKSSTAPVDNLNYLYNSPYSASKGSTDLDLDNKPRTASKPETLATALPEQAHDTRAFWPILFLSLAGNLFALGVLQFFFSENGVVRLEINSSYWFLFMLISIPLFYFGLRQANQLK